MIDLKNKEVQALLLKLLAIFLVLTLLSALLWRPLMTLFSNSESFKQYILGFGIWAPLAYIGLATLQVLISPIPGQLFGLLSGYTFGWWQGTIYGLTGVVLGSLIAFSLSRRYGRPFVEKVIDRNVLTRFDNLSDERGAITLLLVFLLPFMPDDTICFIAGLTKIRIRTLVVIAVIGRLPGTLAINLVGAGIASNMTMTWWMWVSVAAIMAAGLYVVLNKKKVEDGLYHIAYGKAKK